MANPSVKGTPNSAAATSVAIPTHAVGDDIFIFTYRNNATTVPSKPAASGTVPAWVDIESSTGANTNSLRVAHFVATATNHTSGTWSNATGITAVVVQNQAASSIGAHAQGGGTSSTSSTAPAITQQQTTGKALILEFYGHRTVTAWSAAPSGYTNLSSVATQVCLNSKDSSTTDGSIAQNCTTSGSSGYRAVTLEILGTETSPSVALNSPADASSTSDTTPTLTFTGTDSEGDDVSYEVQISSEPFTSSEPVVDSITVGTESTSTNTKTFSHTVGTLAKGALIVPIAVRNSTNAVQQSVSGVTYNGTPLSLAVRKDTVGTRYLFSEIWYLANPSSGTNNVVVTLSGSVDRMIAGSMSFDGINQSSPIDATASGSQNSATVPSVNITTNTNRAAIIDCVYNATDTTMTVGAGQTQRWQVATASTDAVGVSTVMTKTPAGSETMDWTNADEWVSTVVALKPAATTLLVKLSNADSGFAGSPDNSDPFASGQAVDFTVQGGDALATGTYYWRSRGKDPSGSNTFGSWSTARTFTITGGSTAVKDIIGAGMIPFAR